ncbi:MAG: hypothetical protein KH138_02755, partial [Firmicutes bacterium]|nr:hypothetical protein [Bacillota bacterium]
MKKRCLAMIMAFCVALSLVPATALATDGNEEETPSVGSGSTIYVDANSTKDGDGDGSEENPYKSLVTAVNKATSGDTIQLGEGNYTLYGVSSEGHTKGKNLTFVGRGANKTGWNIGAEVPDPANFGTEYNGDYSFDGAGTVTFQNMTLRSVNCTPFVRQYDILSNKWGVLLCQKEYQTNDIR